MTQNIRCTPVHSQSTRRNNVMENQFMNQEQTQGNMPLSMNHGANGRT